MDIEAQKPGLGMPEVPTPKVEEAGLMSANFELPQELDERTRAGVVEVCDLMNKDNLSFDEARLQLVLSRMTQMGVDESGMPTDPKTFTFDQVRARGEVPTPWRREKVQEVSRSARRCATPPPPRSGGGGAFSGTTAGRVFNEFRRLDLLELPMSVTDTKAAKLARTSSPKLWLALRVIILAAAALLMVVLGAREGDSALPGHLAQLPEDPNLLQVSPP